MRHVGFWLVPVLGAGLVVGAAQGKSPGGMVVHEWGTFLAMQGADGVTLEGMYHEEHALPEFVHARSQEQLRLRSVGVKGETPVIYFYTDTPQAVEVRVGFPKGIWTQWYPQAQFIGPQVSAAGTPPDVRNGHLSWRAQVIPAGTSSVKVPASPKGALWDFARDVDAAYVRAGGETERFLFYRGLGRADLPLRMTASAGGTLATNASAAEGISTTLPLRHLFVLRVENGKGAYRYLPSLAPGQTLSTVVPSMTAAKPLPEFHRRVGDELADRLVESGLYPKEARAMVNTWRSSYFQADGTRVLFILPQSWTDAFIPMTIRPQPASLVRVMVGRLELLTPERERKAEAAVRDLGSPDAAVRDRAFAFLLAQGRYVEPVLRRVLASSPDETVTKTCRQLLMTEWVTALRASVKSAAGGGELRDDPLAVRAQLAAVLREAGMDEQARAVAEPVRAELAKQTPPSMDNHEARFYLRNAARAAEGIGDDRQAADAYLKLVRFGSQNLGANRCGGCHQLEGPRDAAWFRDWWAGRRFAHYVNRLGETERRIHEQETALEGRSGDPAARLILAYLYAGRGDRQRAETMWAALGAPSSSRLASGK